MKSASIFLIHSFHRIHKFKPNPHLLLRVNSIFDTAASSSSSSSLVSTDRTFCKTYGTSKFLEISSRTLCAHKEAAETTDERISLLKEMESSSFLEGNEVGLSALIIGIHLYRLGEDPEKVIHYAHKSLRAFDADDDEMMISLVCLLPWQCN